MGNQLSTEETNQYKRYMVMANGAVTKRPCSKYCSTLRQRHSFLLDNPINSFVEVLGKVPTKNPYAAAPFRRPGEKFLKTIVSRMC
jgi:hypothetical protein